MKKLIFMFALVLLTGAITTSGIIIANTLKTEIANDDPEKKEACENKEKQTASTESKSTENSGTETKSSCTQAEKKTSCHDEKKDLTNNE